MTAIVIEDEIPAGLRLEKLLKSKDFDILANLRSVKKSISWLNANIHPDLIFIDIKLSDGNCFDILDKIEIKSKIVFTTAYDEFALNAFKYNSVDYLLKPINEIKLDLLIKKIETLKIGFLNQINWSDFENALVKNFKKSFLISTGNSLKKVDVNEIICFFSENNSTFILTNSNRSFVVNSSLDNLEEELNDQLFFRINRKFIINKDYILSFKNDSQKKICISQLIDFEFFVSKLKSKSFIEWYKK